MNILITGSSKGIGYELCKYFLDNGHTVIAISRNREFCEKSALSKSEKFIPINIDISNCDIQVDIKPLISSSINKIDGLINNAGVLISKPFTELTDNDFDEIFNVNVKAIFKLIRDLVPLFNSNSHIVNISSMGGFQGSAKFEGLSLYSASKGALTILSECLAVELQKYTISCNALAIGAVQTEMLSKAFPDYKAPIQPNEMAEYIANFALTGHKYFNGKVIPVSLSTP